MSARGVIAVAAGVLALAVAAFLLGRHTGRRAADCSTLTVVDTLWVEVHDTAFVEVERLRTLVRRDTVRLAAVAPPQGASPCDSATVSKMEIVDSATVEVPISQYTFEGENWRITAEGYRVSLTDVWMRERVVCRTQTVTRTRRWSLAAGVQVGYGYTLHGASPYAGAGLTFGYVF